MNKLRLNLGCGKSPIEGFVNLDNKAGPGIDVVADLDSFVRLPFNDNSVGEFLMVHSFEHIQNTLRLMSELHRIAKPDATFVARMPYGSSNDAWEDPTHARPYFEGSFGYFSQPYYWRADYGYKGDWQPDCVCLIINDDLVPAENCTVASATTKKTVRENIKAKLAERVRHDRNVVQEMIVYMHAVKPAREPRRELIVPPSVLILTAPEVPLAPAMPTTTTDNVKEST